MVSFFPPPSFLHEFSNQVPVVASTDIVRVLYIFSVKLGKIIGFRTKDKALKREEDKGVKSYHFFKFP